MNEWLLFFKFVLSRTKTWISLAAARMCVCFPVSCGVSNSFTCCAVWRLLWQWTETFGLVLFFCPIQVRRGQRTVQTETKYIELMIVNDYELVGVKLVVLPYHCKCCTKSLRSFCVSDCLCSLFVSLCSSVGPALRRKFLPSRWWTWQIWWEINVFKASQVFPQNSLYSVTQKTHKTICGTEKRADSWFKS